MSGQSKPRLKPLALQPGDTIGMVAPASPFNKQNFERSCAILEQRGYKVTFAPTIFDREPPYFAGSAPQRARNLVEMFERSEVRAIVCARGGYGANYLLDRIDPEVVRSHPKIFMGYSDVTALLTRFLDACGLVTFHGPMMNKDFATEDGIHIASFLAATGGTSEWTLGNDSGLEPIIPGRAEGTLYGGCLSILVASVGTPYEAQTEGKLLFLEDVAAKPYQVDRMLMQMKFAGKFKDVQGVIFGEMQDCRQSAEDPNKLQDTIKRVLGDLGVPIAYGLRSGHVSRANITLPFGVRAAVTVSEQTSLTILESATLPAAATANRS